MAVENVSSGNNRAEIFARIQREQQREAERAREQRKPPRTDALSVAEAKSTALQAYRGRDGFDPGGGRPPRLPDLGKIFDPKTPPPPSPEEQRRAAIDRAIETGEPQDFTNSDGVTETVQIIPSPFDDDQYLVAVGDTGFKVTFDTDEEVDRNAIITQVVDSYSENPAELRDALHEVVISHESSDTDTGQTAAASAGDGKITFWENGQYVDEGVFHHELAHLFGRDLENQDDGFFSDWFDEPPPIPNGWQDAAESDGNFTSDYAHDDYDVDHDYTEDFADGWRAYMQAVDEGPEAVEKFREQFPARYAILKELYDPPVA